MGLMSLTSIRSASSAVVSFGELALVAMKIAPELLAQYDKLMLNALEQVDPRCYCPLDTGANALALPRRDTMKGTDAQCTVLGGSIVPGLVTQVLRWGEEDYHVVAIEGASPLMPLSWLILLAGWSYVPTV